MQGAEYPLWRPVTRDLPEDHFLGNPHLIANQVATRAGVGGNSDTSSPIVAQPLDPSVIPVFVSQFPLYDMLRKVPANGLSHTWLQQTAFTQSTDPNTIAETGVVNDDSNSYLRKTTNIAIFAIRRSMSLKAQFAGNAVGGASADLMGREVAGGVMTLARDIQNESLRYQESDPSSTTATALNGKYDANGFNGMRYIAANEAPPENSTIVDIRTPWTDQRVLKAVRTQVNNLWDKGGKANLIIATTKGSEALFEDQLSLVRYVKDDKQEIIPGLTVSAISTDQGVIPVLVVPGMSLGTYTNATPNTFQDLYICDTDMLELPYLGSPRPSVLRIPTAVAGQLVEVAIPYMMCGLSALSPSVSVARVQLMIA